MVKFFVEALLRACSKLNAPSALSTKSVLNAKSITSTLSALLLMSTCASAPLLAQPLPPAAGQYQKYLTSQAQYSYGLNAPVATLAALIHQESHWQPQAVSPVGAQGMAQFMPATAGWLPQIYPALGAPNPHNPQWAIQAAVLYTHWLNQRIQAANTCQQWAFVLSAYNGGLGWVNKDKQLASAKGADSLVWFNSVEGFNAGRSASNFAENRHYPKAILTQLSPRYQAAGWGLSACQPHQLTGG